jgi:anoctamin-10
VRQSLQIPFALGASGILCILYAVTFAIEVMISEVYTGPFKSVLVFTPTVILTVMVPLITGTLSNIATKLTDFENYENESSYEAAMTQKVFIFNFICSYVPLFLTAFVYVPFGSTIVPHLDIMGFMAPVDGVDADGVAAQQAIFEINPDRLRKQMIYFTVTAQAVNLAMETIVPYFKRAALTKAKEFQLKRSGKFTPINDSPQEAKFLSRVRHEAELGVYNVTDDLREMCMQFGYLCLFSPIWPLAPVSFLVNNWIELRSDAAKICIEMRRPIPHRADSIGPWLDNLGFLTWMGSVSSAVLVYLFSGEANEVGGFTAAGLLASVVFSEHVYFAVRLVVRIALSKLDSPGLVKEKQERFLIRRRYLQESMGVDEETEANEKEVVPRDTGAVATGEERSFWDQQEGARGAIEAGLSIIREEKKEQ